jgi:hypothetical protein
MLPFSLYSRPFLSTPEPSCCAEELGWCTVLSLSFPSHSLVHSIDTDQAPTRRHPRTMETGKAHPCSWGSPVD